MMSHIALVAESKSWSDANAWKQNSKIGESATSVAAISPAVSQLLRQANTWFWMAWVTPVRVAPRLFEQVSPEVGVTRDLPGACKYKESTSRTCFEHELNSWALLSAYS